MLFYDIIIKINEQFFAERRTLMKITKIKISNYKSIKEPIEINFSDLLPTVLIGKNGSGMEMQTTENLNMKFIFNYQKMILLTFYLEPVLIKV